jgi:hypothetical protein
LSHAVGHKRRGKPEVILPRSHSPPLSHSNHVQPPTSVEPPPRRCTRTPPTSPSLPLPHHSLSLSPMPTRARPLETGASTARQHLQPHQWTPRHTAPVAQPVAIDRAACRPPRSPRSDCTAHTPWMPRACTAFLLMHACFSPQQHTNLHDIKATSPRHLCPAGSSPHSPCP